MQLRGVDIIEQDGVNAIAIKPDAGTVKMGRGRVVPLHEHLIAQGFLAFVASRRHNGPLFYDRSKAELPVSAATNPRKPRHARPRERLAAWIRSLGIKDNEVRPNHAWRHTFKRLAARRGIEPGMRDTICGQQSCAELQTEYETPALEDMAAALKKFPRYEV